MAITTLGIDLAKNVFAVHGVDETGLPALVRPRVTRERLLALVASLPPCLIGLEACSSAHYWARQFLAVGHTVRLMAPQRVAPYRLAGQYGKNDAADAAAICEAVTRPTMRFVPVKTTEQQSQLMVHRVRRALVAQRTATVNRLRGFLVELGIAFAPGAGTLRRATAHWLPQRAGWAHTVMADLLADLYRLDERVNNFNDPEIYAKGFKANSYMLGLSAPVGETGKVFTSWQHIKPKNEKLTGTHTPPGGTAKKNDETTNVYSLGYTYDFSKRTNLYSYVSYATNYFFIDGVKSTAAGVGLRHRF